MKSALLKVMTSRPVDHLMSKMIGPFVTIYTLHRPSPADKSFSGIDEGLLEQCLQYAVERGYAFASIDELVESALRGERLTKPTLCFTLDDGYADQLTRLIPVLLKYQAKPTLFAITDFVDKQDWPWDARLAYLIWNTPETQLRLESKGQELILDCANAKERIATRRAMSRYAKTLTREELPIFLAAMEQACAIAVPQQTPTNYAAANWDELRQFEQQGLRVGAHTCTHHVLSAQSDEQIIAELTGSRARIQTEMQNPSQVFCYPSGTAGDFSATRHPALVQQAGFTAAITTISKPTNFEAMRARPFLIDRIGFPETFARFVRYSSWIEVLRSRLS